MATQKLTDRQVALSADNDDLIHVVDISDLTDSPEGSSKKITKGNFLPDISGISTNATAIDLIEAEQITQNNAIALNTDKRSYPLDDENRLANTSGTNTGDQDEQDIISTLIEPTIVAGAYTFDVSTGRAFKFSITEATTLTPPTLVNGTALSFTAIITGNFTLTAATTTITPTSDAYLGTVENRLIYDCYRTSAGVQTNILTLENLA